MTRTILKSLLVISIYLILCMTVYSSEDNRKLININEDPIEFLVTLPGIGTGLAKRIIEYRESNRFEKIEDLLNVEGVGSGNFSKFEDLITVGE